MAKNRLEDLRNHLFAALEGLQDEDKPMDIDRALAVSNVAQSIIDSAKVELKFIELTGQGSDSAFLSPHEPKQLAPGNNGKAGAAK